MSSDRLSQLVECPCHGQGYVLIDMRRVKCTECDGSGYISVPIRQPELGEESNE